MRETRIVTKQHRCVSAIVCDLCGDRTKGADWGEAQFFGHEVVRVDYTSGRSLPEGLMATRVRFDLCPDCFEGKLVPFLKSLGAEPSEVDVTDDPPENDDLLYGDDGGDDE